MGVQPIALELALETSHTPTFDFAKYARERYNKVVYCNKRDQPCTNNHVRKVTEQRAYEHICMSK